MPVCVAGRFEIFHELVFAAYLDPLNDLAGAAAFVPGEELETHLCLVDGRVGGLCASRMGWVYV
jgi:hypothetical protein